MSYEKAVSGHYTHGELLEAIQASILKMGKTLNCVTAEDLAPIDEFHIGGRPATDNLLNQFNFSSQDHILDVGCGLGGAARLIARRYDNHVTGIDLTQEYIDVGRILCTWVGLENQVSLHQGNALAMPFANDTFDGGIMLHVGMNIDDKIKLFTEIYRLLRPASFLGIYDVMRINDGEPAYPLPWSTEKRTCRLATPDQYKHALHCAGFKVCTENNRRDFARIVFEKIARKNKNNGEPPPLGLHTLMQGSAPIKVKNMIDGIMADIIAPVEIIAQKPGR